MKPRRRPAAPDPAEASSFDDWRVPFDAHTTLDLFRYGDVDVGPALEVLPHAVKLERLKQRLDLASAQVGRHIAATVRPVVGIVSDVRRMVVATPEGSDGARRLRHLRR